MPSQDGKQEQHSNKSSFFLPPNSTGPIEEEQPLLSHAGPSNTKTRRRHANNSGVLDSDVSFEDYQHHSSASYTYHSSDESACLDIIMEKVKQTRFAHLVDKLAVEQEKGLTNAQLMLNNHDLKPVEAERRQWGPWNFVGFWVADSFNIVS